MVRKPKRAPGAGRPPKGDFADLASVLSVRMPADMRAQLEASAAQRKNGKGWSLTQEMLHRLQLSFDRERDERRDPASRALCYLLAEVISAVARNNVEPGQWRADPFAFRAIKLAFTQIHDALEPKGKIRSPKSQESDDSFAELWSGPGGMLTSRGQTPEDMAQFIRDVILMRIVQAPLEPHPPTGGPFATVSRTDYEFGMSDASRHLRLTGEQKT
jgi:hypothetical protein